MLQMQSPQYVACSQTLYFLFKVRRARVIKYKPQGIHWHKTTSVYRLPNSPLNETKTKRELEMRCVPQLFLALFLGTHWSAIGQFFSLSLVTVPKVFAKVNSSQSPVSEVENSHSHIRFNTNSSPHNTVDRSWCCEDFKPVELLSQHYHNIFWLFVSICWGCWTGSHPFSQLCCTNGSTQ